MYDLPEEVQQFLSEYLEERDTSNVLDWLYSQGLIDVKALRYQLIGISKEYRRDARLAHTSVEREFLLDLAEKATRAVRRLT